MDKVIIDGVDVSGCSYAITPKRQCPNKPMPYAKETSCISCKEHNTKLNFCKNNPNCYFKQLKRLEQENETLERTNNELRKRFSEDTTKLSAELKELQGKYNGLNANYNSLKFENEQLKEENKQHIKEKQILHERLYCYAYEKDCHLVCKQQNCLLKNSYAYRSALEEIRELVRADCKGCTAECDCDDDCTRYKVKTKINSVIGGVNET